MFYLSEYLEANREEYYRRLANISEDGDWNGWIAFFLRAITHQAKQNSQRDRDIMVLYENMKIRVHDVTHSQYTFYLLDAIFSTPIFSTSGCATRLKRDHKVHTQTTLGLLRRLRESKVLREFRPGKGRRAAILYFPDLINLAEGRETL